MRGLPWKDSTTRNNKTMMATMILLRGVQYCSEWTVPHLGVLIPFLWGSKLWLQAGDCGQKKRGCFWNFRWLLRFVSHLQSKQKYLIAINDRKMTIFPFSFLPIYSYTFPVRYIPNMWPKYGKLCTKDQYDIRMLAYSKTENKQGEIFLLFDFYMSVTVWTKVLTWLWSFTKINTIR